MIEARLDGLKGTKWTDYGVRFVLGGVICVVAGLIAKRWGPGVGGLFLAFPAIFPAGATMIEKREREKKEEAGVEVGKRGRMVAGVDAGGAALGALGLMVFGVVVWRGLLVGRTAWVLLGASLVWVGVSGGLWWVRRRVF